jgi:hypothetical protein
MSQQPFEYHAAMLVHAFTTAEKLITTQVQFNLFAGTLIALGNSQQALLS